ncbi:acyl-CoA thioesterase [Pararhodobacter zhoushanensis]|jgi:acyl-CoA thioesterase YciA|uniref:Acyl-CoA thioesterase n=1 Tax=Pararhodobacter zhoushanensis TaxID=2479545 RepID=A0ABT3GVM8_9RHOB|nr:acyl-CoA thioesterase [Pararhodobacter zhoushanensis]MCW1931580.1 acyl-CoA thioesterase [Pararhodobacter zhoushanensis]
MDDKPEGELTLQTVPFPADTNGAGDIFGGWVLSQMDIAAGMTAARRARGRTATVAINAMRFHAPVMVGDLFTVYTRIVRVGTTSITIHVEAWVERLETAQHLRVTEADFTFVALHSSGVKRPVPPE